MKNTINYYEFEKAFNNYGRSENFTREGLRALFNYLEAYEEDTGEEIELDVIALCCEYTEYTYEEYLDAYFDEYRAIGHGFIEIDEEEETEIDKEAIRAYIEDRTIFIETDEDSFIILNY